MKLRSHEIIIEKRKDEKDDNSSYLMLKLMPIHRIKAHCDKTIPIKWINEAICKIIFKYSKKTISKLAPRAICVGQLLIVLFFHNEVNSFLNFIQGIVVSRMINKLRRANFLRRPSLLCYTLYKDFNIRSITKYICRNLRQLGVLSCTR